LYAMRPVRSVSDLRVVIGYQPRYPLLTTRVKVVSAEKRDVLGVPRFRRRLTR
jgi:hypothetical protein